MSKNYLINKLVKKEPKKEYVFDKDPKKAELEKKMVQIADRVKREGIK